MNFLQSLKLSTAAALVLLLASMVLGSSGGFAASDIHANEIWGSLHTQERSTANIFKDVSISVRGLNGDRPGRVLASTEVLGRSTDGLASGHYAINMKNLPAGKYVVQVLPVAGSEYEPGERVVNYLGKGTSVRQDWTLALTHASAPVKE